MNHGVLQGSGLRTLLFHIYPNGTSTVVTNGIICNHVDDITIRVKSHINEEIV